MFSVPKLSWERLGQVSVARKVQQKGSLPSMCSLSLGLLDQEMGTPLDLDLVSRLYID